MDFAYSADQDEFRTSLRRFLADKSSLAQVRLAAETDLGYDSGLWQQMSQQLGLPGLHIPEEYGGSGTGLFEPAVVLHELGRSLTASPYLPGLLCSLAVLRLGTDDQRKELLPGIASGELITALAMTEVASPNGVHAVQTTAHSRGDQVTLTGTKTLVECGHSADVLLVSATGGDAGAAQALLYVVSADAPGLTRTRQEALDLTRQVAEVRLDAVPATPLGQARSLSGQLPGEVPGQALAQAQQLDLLVDLACALLASEMVGGAEACLEMSVAYAKQRMQFNRPIGSFQAVKHRCAEMMVALDGAKAAAMYAVLVADQGMSADRDGGQGDTHGMPGGGAALATVAPLAKAEAAEAFTFAAGWTVQVLGGIGFTWEHDAHLYFRRAWADSALFGGPAAQRARLADRLGL